MKIEPEALYTEKDLAKLLQLSVKCLQAQRYRGDGIPFIKINRAVRYRGSDIEEYLSQNTVTSTAQRQT